MKTPPKKLTEPFYKEGAKARAKGKPETECPYKMSNALTAAGVQGQVIARQAWMKGYNAQTKGAGK
jgi:ribosome modulation factor